MHKTKYILNLTFIFSYSKLYQTDNISKYGGGGISFIEKFNIAKYSLSDWLEKMPDELLNMRNENPHRYKELYKKQYGIPCEMR